MKECLVNREGEKCDFPVVSGGRCQYHQVGRAHNTKERASMKKVKPVSHKSKYLKLI